MKTIYQERGYKDRKDYLTQLADENGAERALVYSMADILGEGEDWDGLVSSVEDMVWMGI